MRKYLLILLLYPMIVHSQGDSITVKVPVGDPTGVAPMGTKFMSLAQPSAVRYLKINADNSISLRTAAECLTDLGAQASGTYLTAANNLSDLTNAATARTNIGLGNVTNESKATMFSSPTFTGTVSGITATMVGLGNVTNESKATMFTSPTFTGTVTLPASTSLTTPVIGVATGTSLAVTGSITSSGGGIGYATGNGGAVTQLTNKATTVVLNKLSGEITMNAAALAAATIVSFTLTNSTIAATDVLILNHVTTGTRGAYTLNAQCAAGSAVIYIRNNTAGSLGEAIVIRFVTIKSVVN